jgi:HSP20 family protein
MFGSTRWNPFDEMFAFQREADRFFDEIWSALPTRTSAAWSSSFHVSSDDEGWHIDVPLPGIDPQRITLEAAGSTLIIRAGQPAGKDDRADRYEQTITVPQFLDLDRLRASHRHGMLELMLPLKESVRPRRIPIEAAGEQKQLAGVA